LHVLHRGVYLVGHTVPAPLALETAALLACAPAAALSHRSAAKLWNLLPLTEFACIEITIRRQRRPKTGVTLHRAHLSRNEVTKREGLWVTAPARTLADLAAILPLADLEQAVAQAHRLRLIDAQTLAAHGRPGAPALRAVVERGPRFTRSRAERALLALTRRADLPLPETNTYLGGWEVDALWATQRLALEVDGGTYHHTPADIERDRCKEADLEAAGYRVIRVSWRQLRDQTEAVAARLARALVKAESGWAVAGASDSRTGGGLTPPAS
jgi:very-short-patch-repair endonuclease